VKEPHSFASLKKAFTFDEADLAANRQRRLSTAQGDRLRRDAMWAVGAMTLWPVITWVAIAILRPLISLSTTVDVPLGVAGGVSLAISGLMVAPALRHWRRVAAERAEGRVDSADIEGGNVTQQGGNRFPDTIRLDGDTITLTHQQMQALKKGQLYRLYYTHQLERVVAVEPLNEQ